MIDNYLTYLQIVKPVIFYVVDVVALLVLYENKFVKEKKMFYISVPWDRMTCKNELIKNVPTIPLKPWSPAQNECNT